MVNKEKVLEALKKVSDPHMGLNIVDMGLVKDLEVDEEGNVKFKIIPTNPMCMSALHMAVQAKEEVKKLEGVKKVDVKIEGHVMEDELNKILND
ncbi:metal-sulfur cluster assembly factor [Methanocaldococcus infernus]|uniref:MIP18 family-like domain-containing protein n=1 Tax=Methanocaldococcus infernus (strain DSM 11812 / JCM 15783 / ME) TaxID=573063 RepID=D5VTS7_METIM|nr:metal-sulfur cluster assembly factor [Methanocaldococcus infernus]ADG13980.1 protein of unknown function DUF59 [Methanocaldococcus infernus ME]